MADSTDSRLSRWSRRKLAARVDDVRKTLGDQDEASAEIAAGPIFQAAEPDAAEASAIQSPEPLPRLEDVTADSDVTAFLKQGVPTALKSAALRKMWSVDPNIRDFIGPAEYAWDFNQPASMAGFGPLEAGKDVVSFLSRTVRALDMEAEPTSAANAPDDDARMEDEIVATSQALHTPDFSAVRLPVVGPPVPAKIAPELQPTTASLLTPSVAEDPAPRDRPRHGGAMPR